MERDEYQDVADFVLMKIREEGWEIYMYDPAKTVSQPPGALEYHIARWLRYWYK